MKEKIKKVLKKTGLYNKVKYVYKDRNKLTKNYTFENRMKHSDKVCFVLAGYKEFAYEIVFERIKKFLPKNVEVCILSSGKYSERLSKIAKDNDWSYLSTKRNNVALIQNVANNIYKDARYIYKLDEDIFITKNFFTTLLNTYEECSEKGLYNVGFVAPTIPINGFGNMLILDRFKLQKVYENKFEKAKYAAGSNRMVENNPDVAKFFWGYENYLPNIDEIDNILHNDAFSYVACPIRFSIGAILYTREFWKEMGMFTVKKGPGMGLDEIEMCSYAMCNSKAIIISKNTAVGHLSFGKQNETMKKYFQDNIDVFKIHEVNRKEV